MKNCVSHIKYDRSAVSCGILHIGVGDFHRAHQQYYINEFLNMMGNRTWGVAGVMLDASDEKMFRALSSQEGLYTLTCCRPGAGRSCQEIGSLIHLLWAPEDPQAVIDMIADCAIRIITLTIGSDGYDIGSERGEPGIVNPAVKADLTADVPATVFGLMAHGLERRRRLGNGPVTVLSCDSIRGNGHVARRAFMTFMEAFDPELARWAADNVTFPASVADRISYAPGEADACELNRQNGSHDLAPMVCEDYVRWVVEDDFAAGRPALERVGVEFVNDVTDYDNMRYGFDEAARLMLAYPAYIAGYRKVDHAVHDCRFRTLLRDFLEKDAGACISIPPQVDAEAYRNGLLERFSNAEVCESLAGVCSGGLSRMSVSIVPTLGEMLKRGMDTSRIAYLMAACRHYLKYRTDDDGRTFNCDEPAMTDSVRPLVESDDPLDFLRLPVFASLPLVSSESFRKEFLDSAEAIERYGAMRALEYII